MGRLILPRASGQALNTLSGSAAELAFDTTEENLRVYTGASPSGKKVLTKDQVEALIGTPIWFSARLTNTQTVSGRVPFNNLVGSGGGGFSGNTYTVPSSGVYLFTANILRDGDFNSSGVSPFIRINGDNYAGGYAAQVGTETQGFLQAGVTAVCFVSEGDVVDVFQPDSIRITGSATEPRTWFQGHKI